MKLPIVNRLMNGTTLGVVGETIYIQPRPVLTMGVKLRKTDPWKPMLPPGWKP